MTVTGPRLAELRIDALLHMTQAIETAATIDELLLLALNEYTRLLGLPHGGVLLLDSDHIYASLVSTFPPRVKPAPSILLSSSPSLQKVVDSRLPIHETKLKPGPKLDDIALVLDLPPTVRTALLLPLVAQDSVIGVVGLASADSGAQLSQDAISLARVMSGQLAASIAAFQTTEEARRRSTELLTLSEIASTVTSSLDPHEVYRLVQRKLNEHFNVEAGSLLMIDEPSGDLVFVMQLEDGEEQLSGRRVPQGQGIAGLVARTGRYELVLDGEHDPRIYRNVSVGLETVTRSMLCAPMLVKGHAIGVVQLLNKRDGQFTDEDGERLTRMATTIGIAIENARLFQQVTDGRDQLEAILNSTTDGILMVDLAGHVVMANPMAAQVLRHPREALIGKEANGLLHDLHTQARDAVPVPEQFHDPHPSEPIELEMLAQDIPFRHLRYSILPVHDAGGAEIGHLILFQDTTKAKELDQLRDDYIGMLVHDLRAPLTAIMNGVLMVSRGMGGPVTPQQQELLGIAHQGTQTMLEMVNTLLDITKMEQNRMVLDIERAAPNQMVEQARQRLRASLQGQNIHLDLAIADDLPLIDVDQNKVIRVLQNLLDNAIKFSPTGSTVTIGIDYIPRDADQLPLDLPSNLEGADEWMVFWVKDQGPGIAPQYHARIFEKFGQASGRKARGTGLGLTFCKLAVEAHKGQIWLKSEEGQGSTFAFALPLERV
jgi:NtrC-family two-component system sensor histidine kinase KinB